MVAAAVHFYSGAQRGDIIHSSMSKKSRKKANRFVILTSNFKILILVFLAILFSLIVFFVIRNDNQVNDSSENVDQPTSYNKEYDPYECIENPIDKCVFSPAVDFWPSGSEGNTTNGDFPSGGEVVMKSIGGVIRSINGESVVIDTKSNRQFTIIFPLKAVEWWNSTRSSYYDGYQIGVGDIITIMYREKETDNLTTINPDQIFSSSFAIKEVATKAELLLPIQRYDKW